MTVPHPTPEQPPSEPRVHILLVDDQPANLLALEAILEDLGHNLVRARSGEEALRRLLDHEFALVLLDVQMPGLDGFETAKLIRGREESWRTPIIFLTGYDDDRFPVTEAYALGVVDYLVKPLVPVILRAKVAGFVELFQKTQQVKQQADALRQRDRLQFEERHQAISDFLSDVTCVARIDERGVPELESVSEGFTRISGYTLEELSERGGVPFAIHPDDVLVALGSLERVLSGEQDRNEIRMMRKDGDIRWIRYLAQPEPDAEQGVVRIRALAQDVTERKQALQVVEESERRFRQLAENVHEVFWLTDPSKTQILYVNPAYEKIWGRSCQSLYEQPMSYLEAIHPEDQEAVIATFDRHGQGELTSVEYRIVRPDGANRWILDRGFPIKDEVGEIQRVAGIAEDITERKRAEEALMEADRLKDEFLATLAHELRNPLAPIRNALQIMKMPRVDAATIERSRAMMERQVQQLVRLVDDLLDVSRVMRGKIELRREQVELATIVARAVETVQPLIDAQGHELTVQLPRETLLLDADPVRMVQVVGNLLTNAAKYTEAKGRIWLTAQREGTEAVLRLRDSGIGIAPEMLPRIFELFIQVDHTTTRSQGGLGIGLTLVRNLVEMHHGTIAAHSPGLGEGSEFVVRLPLAALAQAEPAGPEVAQLNRDKPPVGHRLLVVDDNVDAADSLATLLRLQGHEVRLVHDGPAALEMAKAYRPELVFLDIGMPGMDGHEVARRLRQQPGLENIRLAAVTGWGQPEDRRRSKEAGFDHHLVKPPDPKALDEVLASLKLPTG